MLRVHLFGGLAVSWDETLLPAIAGTVPRSLFAYLLTYRDRPHTRDLLAGTFWPDLPDDVARRRLSQALWQIRKALDPHPVLLTESDTVQVNPDLPLWLDIEEFARHQAQCLGEDTAGESEAIRHCELCLEHYRGDFLAGYYDDWLFPEREQLRDQLLEVLERLVVGYKSQGDYQAALTYARRLASEDPWREEAHREVMRLCHVLGQGAEALKQYDICRQILAEEFGAEPSPETEGLAAEIAERAVLQELPWAPVAARPSLPPMLDHPDRLPLVGRESALAEMLKQVEAAAQGAGGLILLYGEAGVGKTRLLRELARNAQWRGIRTAWGRCCELAGPQPYQPLLEVLRTDLSLLSETSLEPLWRAELARLLPELATGESPPPMEPEQEQHRLLEAIARGLLALVRTTPGVILLEDAHWIDPDSLAAIRYLLPRLESVPLLIVVSARGEELAGQQAAGLSTLERTRLPRRLEVGRLTRAESGELVQHALGLEQPPPRFTARLFAETEGNPFFLTETLRALVDEGLLYRDELGQWSTPWDESTEDYAEMPLPASVTHSIECRLDLLPGPLRGALDLAAVIGRGVPFALWQQAGHWGAEELLSIGDELCRRGLLLYAEAEMAVGADYVFAHDQIRRVTYEQLAGPRCRLYHTRVAEGLTRAAEESGTPTEPGTLAYHWTAAQVWDKAADYHQQAGDRAQGVYANAKAVTHYTQALEALERLPGSPDPVRALELRLAREAVLALQGERASQALDLAAAQALAEQLDDAQLARVTLRQARYCVDVSDYPRALHHLEHVVAWARAMGDRRSEATGLKLLGDVHLRLGDGTRARGYGEQALAIYRSMGDRQREAQSLGACGIACYVAGDLPAAQQYNEQALDLCQTLGDRRGEGLNLYRLGRFSRDLGKLAIARDYLMQALTTTRITGDRQLEAYYQLELGNLYYALGDYARARETLGNAAGIFGQISEPRGKGSSLMDLGLVYLAQGEYEQARSHCEQGLDLLSSVGDRWTEVASLNYLGQVLERQGDLEAAAKAFEQALAINQEANQPARTMRDLAGLARIALAQGRLADAVERVQEILSWISVHGIAGIDYPLVVYLTVYRVLAQAGETEQAGEILDEAYALLMERAARLDDEDLRSSFLENVAEHREILAVYRGLYRCSIRARLPRADAPTGRPLRDDEYVTVTWTVAAPEDEALRDGPARRQARIQRLLQEAAEQGATPTVGDLAAALDVSEPTVRRDLAALRQAGHPVQTRGSRGG